MQVNKPPSYKTQLAPVPRTFKMSTSMSLPISTYDPKDYVPPSTSIGSASMPPMGGTSDTTSIPP